MPELNNLYMVWIIQDKNSIEDHLMSALARFIKKHGANPKTILINPEDKGGLNIYGGVPVKPDPEVNKGQIWLAL